MSEEIQQPDVDTAAVAEGVFAAFNAASHASGADDTADAPAEENAPAETEVAAPATEAAPAKPTITREEIERRRKLDQRADRIEHRSKELEAKKAAFEAERAAFLADVKALREGDMATKVKVLARQAGADPVELFRELSATAIGAEPKTKEQQILEQIAELKAELTRSKQEQTERETAAQKAARLQQRQQQVVAQLAAATKDPDEPELCELAGALGEKGAVDFMLGVGRRIHASLQQAGEKLTPREAPYRIAFAVRKYLRSPEGKAFLAAHAQPAEKPAAESSARERPAASLSAAQTDTPSGSDRQLTAPERRQIHKKFNQRAIVDELFPGLLP